MISQRVWDMGYLNLEQLAALSGSWRDWIDVDLLSVFIPFATKESPPFATFVFEDVASVVPVAVIPGPVMLEALFGWSPVMVLTVGPLVPDTLSWVPLEWVFWLVFLFTPIANLWMLWMISNKVKAGLLGSQDSFVLGVDIGCGLSVVTGVSFFGVGSMGTNSIVLDFEKG